MAGIRVVYFKVKGRKKRRKVVFHTGTKAKRKGHAARVRQGKKLARKFKLVWKGPKGHKRVFLKVGKRLKKIRQPH